MTLQIASTDLQILDKVLTTHGLPSLTALPYRLTDQIWIANQSYFDLGTSLRNVAKILSGFRLYENIHDANFTKEFSKFKKFFDLF